MLKLSYFPLEVDWILLIFDDYVAPQSRSLSLSVCLAWLDIMIHWMRKVAFHTSDTIMECAEQMICSWHLLI